MPEQRKTDCSTDIADPTFRVNLNLGAVSPDRLGDITHFGEYLPSVKVRVSDIWV